MTTVEDNTTNAMKALAARLFRKDGPAQAEPEPAEQKPHGNYVPREGNSPERPRDPNEQLRQYTADIFYRA